MSSQARTSAATPEFSACCSAFGWLNPQLGREGCGSTLCLGLYRLFFDVCVFFFFFAGFLRGGVVICTSEVDQSGVIKMPVRTGVCPFSLCALFAGENLWRFGFAGWSVIPWNPWSGQTFCKSPKSSNIKTCFLSSGVHVLWTGGILKAVGPGFLRELFCIKVWRSVHSPFGPDMREARETEVSFMQFQKDSEGTKNTNILENRLADWQTLDMFWSFLIFKFLEPNLRSQKVNENPKFGLYQGISKDKKRFGGLCSRCRRC